MNKILVVSNLYPDDKHPFARICVRNFCSDLTKLGVDFERSIMTMKDSSIHKLITYIGFYFFTFIRCLLKKYDIVYVHYPSYSGLPVIAAHLFRKFIVVVNCHGSDVFPITQSQKFMFRYTCKMIKISKCVVVPSEYFKKEVTDKFQYDDNRIFVYPSGGVNIHFFKPYKKSRILNLRLQHHISLDRMCVGFVGRITQIKGWDTFLLAASKVIQDGYNCEFIMVGGGEDEGKAEELINDLHMSDFVHRFPMQDNSELPSFYNMMDVFVFPTSAAESLGLVAIEAMACGCPVIASDYAAPGSYVIDGINGMKFLKGSSEALTIALEKFLNLSENERCILQRGALDTAKKYSTDYTVETLRRILNEVF